MFESAQKDSAGQGALAIDIAPLIDVVFILLIFFLVTTSFLKDTGIAVELPSATQAQPLDSGSLRVAIGTSGTVYTDGAAVTDEQLTARIRDFVAREPQGTVILLPDRDLLAGRLVDVMDRARAAGAAVAVGANRPTGGRR